MSVDWEKVDLAKEPCRSCKVPRTKVRDLKTLLECYAKCAGCKKVEKYERKQNTSLSP